MRRTSRIDGNAGCVVTLYKLVVWQVWRRSCLPWWHRHFLKDERRTQTQLCEVFTCFHPGKAIFLCQEKLYAHQNKCFFEKKSIEFLGHTVSKDGWSVDKRKTLAIDKMATPTTRKRLFRFLDLAGHYRRFYAILLIKHFFFLSELIKKEVSSEWSDDQDEAYWRRNARHNKHLFFGCWTLRANISSQRTRRDFAWMDSDLSLQMERIILSLFSPKVWYT